MTTQPSATPRTDKEVKHWSVGMETVSINFARTLETELAAAKCESITHKDLWGKVSDELSEAMRELAAARAECERLQQARDEAVKDAECWEDHLDKHSGDVGKCHTMIAEQDAELARLRAENERLKASANHHRDLGITLLDAKWLDTECHTGCQSLAWKARAERAEAQLAAVIKDRDYIASHWSLKCDTLEAQLALKNSQCERAEQAAAGAQRNLAAARKDSERMEWLNRQGQAYGTEETHEGNRWEISGAYAFIQDAIDAAMTNSKNT